MRLTDLVEILKRGSARHKGATYTGQNKHRKNIYPCTENEIREHYSNVRADENISCFRSCSRYDRRVNYSLSLFARIPLVICHVFLLVDVFAALSPGTYSCLVNHLLA
jgi:hypothetical protein